MKKKHKVDFRGGCGGFSRVSRLAWHAEIWRTQFHCWSGLASDSLPPAHATGFGIFIKLHAETEALTARRLISRNPVSCMYRRERGERQHAVYRLDLGWSKAVIHSLSLSLWAYCVIRLNVSLAEVTHRKIEYGLLAARGF